MFFRPEILAIQLALSHCMVRTREPKDWDAGDNSFVHTMHKFVHQFVDVFPLYFISNNTNMRYIWYRLSTKNRVCLCVEGLTSQTGNEVVVNDMTPGYVSSTVSRNEFNALQGVVDKLVVDNQKLQNYNKCMREQSEKQQHQIEMMMLMYDYASIRKEDPPVNIKQTAVLKLVADVHPMPINPFKKLRPAEDLPVPNVQVEEKIEEVPKLSPVVEAPVSEASKDVPFSSQSRLMLGLSQPKVVKNIIIKNKSPYTKKEDALLIEYAKKNHDLGGKKVWKILEAKGTIPGRSFESLRNRYLRHLRPHL